MSPSTAHSDRAADGLIILDTPVALPPVLDLLIVGGGPAGTACAFRAKELGMTALVIEMDDLMKRIRDYATDKPILPDYGGGDTMEFPAGGELVASLRFGPIDKDRMVEQWKALYRKHSVPAQVGVELLQIDRQPDGTWRADARNHYTKQNQSFVSRTIVLALGRGVPRRLDIPGNVQDLALRLVDAEQYVGGPACVIGGGTSSAEAVIAISNAKAQSGTDETPVYWSYRGRMMPKVSQALAPELFDAMMMNGNLRFVPGSDPVAVNTHEGKDYVAIRTAVTDRPGQARAVVHLEFPKTRCVACIGADRPDPLLRGVGVDFVPKESGEGDRVVVSPLLGTRRPGLHLGGDLLSPDYAETIDFDAHPSTFTLQPRRGNIKAALRDGVLLAEIVKQCLEGKQEIRVVMSAASSAPIVSPSGRALSVPAAASSEPRSPGRLIALLADGTPSDEFPLVANGVTTIGRQGTAVMFPQDSMLSDHHASISHGPAGLELRDLGSSNGVFLKIPEGRVVMVAPGTIVKAGRQWLITQESAGLAEILQCDAAGRELSTHRVPEGTTLVLGRAAPSTVLDAADTTLSRLHLSFSVESGRLMMRDLGSRNGTFIRVDERWPLEDGDLIWLGNQQLRVVIGDGRAALPAEVRGTVSQTSIPTPSPGFLQQRVDSGVTSLAPVVTFGPGKTFPFGASATLLDLALARRVRIKYDCKVGDCGKCRVEVTAGAGNLDPKSAQEVKALRMIGHEEPESRLACLVTKVTGPVSIQVP